MVIGPMKNTVDFTCVLAVEWFKDCSMKTSNDMFPGEASERIEHLMRFYHWDRLEATSYFFYEAFDPIDWIDYE